MIRFSCPKCRSVVKVDDHRAGGHVYCPSCGDRLLIPTPAPQALPVACPIEPMQPATAATANPFGLSQPGPAAGPWRQLRGRVRRWLTLALVAFVLAGGAFAIVKLTKVDRQLLSVAYNSPEKRSETRCKEEEVVRKFVLHARSGSTLLGSRIDAAGIEFLSWGPHDLYDEVGIGAFLADRKKSLGKSVDIGLLPVGDVHALVFDEKKPVKMVRVQYRLQVEGSLFAHGTEKASVERDEIYFLQDNEVVARPDAFLLGHAVATNKDGDSWKEAWKKRLDSYK